MNEKETQVYNWLERWGTAAARVASILVLLGSIWVWFTYAKDFFNDIGEIPERIEQLENDVDAINANLGSLNASHLRLAGEVERATQPRQIFEINNAFTQARDGYCTEYARCIIDVRMRRTAEGERCHFLQGRDRYFFVDGEGQRVEVERIDREPDPDIGREWFDFHWEFETPARLAVPVGLEFQRAYSRCRDENDPAVIIQSSDLLEINIRPAAVTVTP